MSKKRKGQTSFEYILVAAVIGITVLPAAYLFYKYSFSTADQIDKAQLDQLGRDIASTAEKIYYQGAPSRTELEARMPKGIQNVSILGGWGKGQELVFTSWSSEYPVTDFPYPIKVNVNGTFNGSLYPLSTGAGIKKINIEAYDTQPGANGQATSFVYINFGGRCPVSTNYDPNGDGYFTGIDYSWFIACYKKSRPSKAWQSGWFDGGICMNADYNGDCIVDNTDQTLFCTKTGLC